MRVAVLGGTRFVGRALVAELLEHGHEVLVVHRGEHEPDDLPEVAHLHVHRRRLGERRAELARFGADALADLSAMTGADAESALAAIEPGPRLVVASSMDVYRAFESLVAGRVTDPVPLGEDSPLRSGPPPDAGATPQGWDVEPGSYEKLDVERAYLARGGTVCRLPFVYGEHDYQRREEFVLGRLRAGRRRIPIGSGAWLGSRGYVGELAAGMRLALESEAVGGEVLNLCEQSSAPMRLWAEQILAAAGADAELVLVPDERLPPDLWLTGAPAQHILADPGKARERLGWTHGPAEECVPRSVAWHREHPPKGAGGDFAADDAALEDVTDG